MIRAHRALLLLTCLSASMLGALGCQAPSEDLRVWQPSDHRNTSNEAAQAQQSDGQPQAAPPGLDPLTLRTWAAQCATCHGQIGRGDGPQAAMFKPPDLSDPSWQGQVTDERIATSIQEGRGQMPSFKLPEATLKNLVNLVRLFNRERAREANPAAGPAGSPATRPANAHAGSAKQPGRAANPE